MLCLPACVWHPCLAQSDIAEVSAQVEDAALRAARQVHDHVRVRRLVASERKSYAWIAAGECLHGQEAPMRRANDFDVEPDEDRRIHVPDGPFACELVPPRC